MGNRRFETLTFDEIFEPVNNFFNSVYQETAHSYDRTSVSKDNGQTIITVELPGVPKEDIKVTHTTGIVTINVENEKIKYTRKFKTSVKKKNISMKLDLGVLTVVLKQDNEEAQESIIDFD
jgi:HSP20 family molecular chaperone IbpA